MTLTGKGAAPGAAAGRIFVYDEKFAVPAEKFISAGEEQSNLDKYISAKKEAIKEISNLKTSM